MIFHVTDEMCTWKILAGFVLKVKTMETSRTYIPLSRALSKKSFTFLTNSSEPKKDAQNKKKTYVALAVTARFNEYFISIYFILYDFPSILPRDVNIFTIIRNHKF